MPIYNPPPTQASAGTYTVSGVDTDRTINVDVTTLNELLNVVGTLILDMKTAGLLT
jgi:hypothetical protein